MTHERCKAQDLRAGDMATDFPIWNPANLNLIDPDIWPDICRPVQSAGTSTHNGKPCMKIRYLEANGEITETYLSPDHPVVRYSPGR